ncbi:hypothetical protein [Streptomyces sp. ALI-76-A]|uniref:hypothetical protein n=1 Tax=Streptomyces sp. ALI-76-A TaxID=3025736 RepID=UPI0033651A56
MLRGLAAAAAATAIIGAVVLRRWDIQAGKQVADLTRARAGDEWRFEERVAELEADLEESRELRIKLEQRLRAKRSELAGLRNEHAALLRRYATAETERASALEGRRLLEIETSVPTPALLPSPAAPVTEAGAVAAPAVPEPGTDEAAQDARAEESAEETSAEETPAEETPVARTVFSPEGSQLFLRAKGALARFDEDGSGAGQDGDGDHGAGDGGGKGHGGGKGNDSGGTGNTEPLDSPTPEAAASAEIPEPVSEVSEAPDASEAPQSVPDAREPAAGAPGTSEAPAASQGPASPEAPEPAKAPRPEQRTDDGEPRSATDSGSQDAAQRALEGAPPHPVADEPVTAGSARGATAGVAEGSQPEAAQEDEAQGKPEAVDEHARATATPSARATQPAQQPSGHFIAPTAVAVVPPAPARRLAVEGGFDFFGTKQGATPAALAAVQNEDLADVVGQEALALHKAESEAEFKPADQESRGVGQVIDLTAHDETEQIDMQGLRSAVS